MSRFSYVKYDDKAAEQQKGFKEMHELLAQNIEQLSDGRGKALALTKLEECYMWIGKAIRDDQIKRNGGAEELPERKDG